MRNIIKVSKNRSLLAVALLLMTGGMVISTGCGTTKKTAELSDEQRDWIDKDTELWLEDQGRPRRALSAEEKARIRTEYRELIFEKYRYRDTTRHPYLLYQAESGGF